MLIQFKAGDKVLYDGRKYIFDHYYFAHDRLCFLKPQGFLYWFFGSTNTYMALTKSVERR